MALLQKIIKERGCLKKGIEVKNEQKKDNYTMYGGLPCHVPGSLWEQ
jgi:hypothetical protein